MSEKERMTGKERREAIKDWALIVLIGALLCLVGYGFIYVDQLRVSQKAVTWVQRLDNQDRANTKQLQEFASKIKKLENANKEKQEDGETKK